MALHHGSSGAGTRSELFWSSDCTQLLAVASEGHGNKYCMYTCACSFNTRRAYESFTSVRFGSEASSTPSWILHCAGDAITTITTRKMTVGSEPNPCILAGTPDCFLLAIVVAVVIAQPVPEALLLHATCERKKIDWWYLPISVAR